MTTAASSFHFDVRFPQLLLDQMGRGEMTVSMLLAMMYLHKWADWKTGQVAHASAGGLRTATARAFSVRTFQLAMKRLEDMGWITRHTITGSHQDYQVTLHNYKWVDEAGKIHILNNKPLVAPRLARKKHGKHPVNSSASKDHATEACAEECGGFECGEAKAGKSFDVEELARKLSLRKDGERHENASACNDPITEACAERCTETSDKILSLIDSQYDVPAAERRTHHSASPVKPNPILPRELPDDFQPDDSNREYAKKKDLDLEYERDYFVDMHRSIGNRRVNWQSVFRRHLTNTARPNPKPKQKAPAITGSASENLRHLMEKYQ